MSNFNSYYGKTKEEIIDILKSDHRFSKEWIEMASSILYHYTYISEYDLYLIKDPMILKLILDYLEFANDNKFVNMIIGYGLNATQVEIYIEALKNNISIELIESLIKQNIPYTKLDYIIKALIEGVDILNIIPDINKYTNEQLYEIYAGIKMGIDYTIYLDPGISAPIMNIIRLSLKQGLNVEIKNYSVLIS